MPCAGIMLEPQRQRFRLVPDESDRQCRIYISLAQCTRSHRVGDRFLERASGPRWVNQRLAWPANFVSAFSVLAALALGCQRQCKPECRPLSFRTLEADRSTVALDDLARNV
jgi:hypothetical protein